MELYSFVRGAFAWTLTIAALWPLNVPLAALAYRIWHGNKPLGADEREELWPRSALGALVIGIAGLVSLVVDYVLADWAGIPAGPVHLGLYLAWLCIACWLVMLFFALEDFFQALGFLIIYLWLPVFVLWPVNWLLGLWNPLLNLVLGYLQEPHV